MVHSSSCFREFKEFQEEPQSSTLLITVSATVAMEFDEEKHPRTPYNLRIFVILAVCIVIYLINLLLAFFDSGLSKRCSTGSILFAAVTLSQAAVISIACTAFGFVSLPAILWIILVCCIGIIFFCLNKKYYLTSWQGLAFCLLWGLVSSTLVKFMWYSVLTKVRREFRESLFRFCFVDGFRPIHAIRSLKSFRSPTVSHRRLGHVFHGSVGLGPPSHDSLVSLDWSVP